jgi:cytochrome c oxidase assembly protein subunit 16
MGIFQAKKFRSSAQNNTVAAKYRNALARHPFALFGLPFIATMLLGSFFLTPATALRYERHDRKVRQVTKDEELGIGKDRRKIDLAEEYYVSDLEDYFIVRLLVTNALTPHAQKLAAKDLDNWEQKRVKRLPGEHDGVI